MELQKGRPEESSGRLKKENRVYDLLDRLAIPYLRIDHEPTDTMEACNEIDRILAAGICKNLFLCNRQKTKHYLIMILGNKHFKAKELTQQINSARLSFASSEDMLKFLDTTPGSVSILGLMNDRNNEVQLLVDQDVLKEEYIGCHPCINTTSLKIKTADLIEKYLPSVNHDLIIVHLCGET